MKIFEYKTFKDGLSDSEMNALGQCGWEFVSHTALYVPDNRRNPVQYYVFKRKIIEP